MLADDKEWDRALSEAAVFKMPPALRQLFAIICAFRSPNEPLKLWKKHLLHLCEDFRREGLTDITITDITAEQRALAHVRELLALNGKKLSEFNLPEVDKSILNSVWRLKDEYDVVHENECAQDIIASFNDEQRIVFDEIMKRRKMLK